MSVMVEPMIRTLRHWLHRHGVHRHCHVVTATERYEAGRNYEPEYLLMDDGKKLDVTALGGRPVYKYRLVPEHQ